ncbi:MerR family transcriptional regulator [Subtercola frigoramans]|uniref:DNA-binding transcriptional MerR regulator n=1 Tax=Subtercola frigoramans TaxID=120298 RepID=A0ABS2L2Y3_9MICO|nr:MerR family transcriptional regulator [Subtercola frigoramans]MBM7471095.1 DNA-binding transcriptional MerR regulator [Subtercola frigoramans]
MKMSELSSLAEVPVATIKFYLREGLLQAGVASSPNQASYDEEHVRRLRLIRALLDVGGLSVASARGVIDSIYSDATLAETFEIAQNTVSEALDAEQLDPSALQRIDTLVSDWAYQPTNPGRLAAGRVLSTFEAVGQRDDRGWFARYKTAALLAAEADLDEIETRQSRESQAETVVVGTVLGDALFAALRRIAQEHVTHQRYSPEGTV